MSDSAPSKSAYDWFLVGASLRSAPEARYGIVSIVKDELKTTEERWAFSLGLGGCASILDPRSFEELRLRAFQPDHVLMYGIDVIATIADLGVSNPQVLRDKFEEWMKAHGEGGYYTSPERSAELTEALKQDPWIKTSEVAARLNRLLEIDREGISAALLSPHPAAERTAESRNEHFNALRLLKLLLPSSLHMQVDTFEEKVLNVRFWPSANQATSWPAAIHSSHDLGSPESGRAPRCIRCGQEDEGLARECLGMPGFEPSQVSTPCLDPAKMNGFADQFGGSDDPDATPLPPPSPLLK